MITTLNDELAQALDTHGGQPIKVQHPATHQTYVLVDSDTHERAMRAPRAQNDLVAIQRGIEAMEASNTFPLVEADARIRAEFGFSPREP